MKRRIFLIQLFFLILWISFNESYDYKVHTTYSSSGPDSRRTELLIVVYNPIVNRQKIYRIVKDFIEMNGKPDTLNIAIYWRDIDIGSEIMRFKVIWEEEL